MNPRIPTSAAALLLAACCLPLGALQAQNPPPTAREVAEQKTAEQQKDKTLLDLYRDGGPVMH
jgi:hypothetical protein